MQKHRYSICVCVCFCYAKTYATFFFSNGYYKTYVFRWMFDHCLDDCWMIFLGFPRKWPPNLEPKFHQNASRKAIITTKARANASLMMRRYLRLACSILYYYILRLLYTYAIQLFDYSIISLSYSIFHWCIDFKIVWSQKVSYVCNKNLSGLFLSTWLVSS